MDFIFWPVLIPICAIIGAFAYGIVRAVSNARVRELEVRERIAMIERGLVPPPEKDPSGFDLAMKVYDQRRSERETYGRHSPGRYRSAGVTIMGVGFGLMLLIGVAGDSPDAAVGVGGFLVVMGLAFVVNSWLGARYDGRTQSPPPSMPPVIPPASNEPPRSA
ncbi:MAG TPA: hypothetical protein VGY48_35275 [Vicinamibacterales bacterium]|jgi:hypothetical protein|nr:hypothetical protein [Vicinamibacterales bacterium]